MAVVAAVALLREVMEMMVYPGLQMSQITLLAAERVATAAKGETGQTGIIMDAAVAEGTAAEGAAEGNAPRPTMGSWYL